MDTTNPPGNERICADYLAGLLAEVGYKPELLEAGPGRTNLIVRYRGTGAGFTDAKFFSEMGARWYERVPIAGLVWGTEVLDGVVREICA